MGECLLRLRIGKEVSVVRVGGRVVEDEVWEVIIV